MEKRGAEVVEQDGPWFVAYRAELHGANGQDKSREDWQANVRGAVALIPEHRR